MIVLAEVHILVSSKRLLNRSELDSCVLLFSRFLDADRCSIGYRPVYREAVTRCAVCLSVSHDMRVSHAHHNPTLTLWLSKKLSCKVVLNQVARNYSRLLLLAREVEPGARRARSWS
jgi:hypothetical protein